MEVWEERKRGREAESAEMVGGVRVEDGDVNGIFDCQLNYAVYAMRSGLYLSSGVTADTDLQLIKHILIH